MKRIFFISLALIASLATIAQTASTVNWINTNFDEDEGVVSRGEITGPWAKSVLETDDYSFTDDNGTNKVRASFSNEGGGGGKALTVPGYNQVVTLGAIMEIGEGSTEVLQVKYWHYGENSIIDELGITSVDQIVSNPVDAQPFVLAGKFTGQGSASGKYIFEDITGTLELTLGNMTPPVYNVDMNVFGVIDSWWPTYEVYFFEEATITGVVNNQIINFNIYPNPASDILNIDYNGEYTNINIVDITGKTVITSAVISKVDITSLSSGIYFVSVLDNTQTLSINKFLIK